MFDAAAWFDRCERVMADHPEVPDVDMAPHLPVLAPNLAEPEIRTVIRSALEEHLLERDEWHFRFAALGFYWRVIEVARQDVEMEAEAFTSDTSINGRPSITENELFDAARKAFADLSDFLPLDYLSDDKRLNWELRQAWLGGHTLRIEQLCNRKAECGYATKEEASRQAGWMIYLSCMRDAFPGVWKEYLSTENAVHHFFALRCVFRPPRELDTKSIHKAAFLLESGLRNSEGVPDAYYAALGDCYWRLDDDLKCAGTWETRGVHYPDPMADDFLQYLKKTSKPGEPEVTGPKEHPILVSAEIIVGIADAWDRSGNFDRAEKWLKRAIERGPRTKNLNRRLAELLAREHRPDEAGGYFLGEMKVNSDLLNDPGTQLTALLAQKLQELNSLEHAQALARSPESRAQRTAIEGVLPLHWPAYAQLTAEAREHWLDALMFHSGPDPGMSDERRNLSAAFFAALAAEVELRNFVFKPFRKNLSEESRRLTDRWKDANLQPLRLFLGGIRTPSFGQMLDLLWVAESPADELQKVFAREVQSRLGSNLRKLREARWKDIIAYRADAVHEGSISAKAVDRLLALAKEFLETLHAQSAPSGGAVRGTPSPGTPIRR